MLTFNQSFNTVYNGDILPYNIYKFRYICMDFEDNVFMLSGVDWENVNKTTNFKIFVFILLEKNGLA